MNAKLERLIRERAFEIWQVRQAMGMRFKPNRAGAMVEITAQDDWLEAEDDIANPESAYAADQN